MSRLPMLQFSSVPLGGRHGSVISYRCSGKWPPAPFPNTRQKSFFPLSPWIYSRIFFSLPGRFFFLNCEVWKKKYISMSTFRWTQLDGSTPTTSAVQASGTIWKHLARRDILPFFPYQNVSTKIFFFKFIPNSIQLRNKFIENRYKVSKTWKNHNS